MLTNIQRHREPSEGKKRLVRIANAISNPVSAPILAQMVSRRRSMIRVDSRETSARPASAWPQNCNRTNTRTATSKYGDSTVLWMNRSSVTDEESCQQSNARLELQTNNSRRGGSFEARRQVLDNEDSDLEEISVISNDSTTMENTSAVAKGADAMVKNSLSRQTEIIDTSKLAEEGKVETEYEDPPEVIEEQDHAMVDEYERTFAYARRLRALLNMQFKEVDKGTIETNFLMVKAHEHPTQRMTDRWRNVDMGVPYNEQVRRQKMIEDYKANALKKKGKKGEEPTPVYPDLIKFTVRFRKENSQKRWEDFMAHRRIQKKLLGSRAGAVPKPNDKYVFAYLDVWSFSVVVFVKPSATVRDIVDPVFSRVGLERRADFAYTVGCFNNDKRAGKAKLAGVPSLAEPVEMHKLAGELYKTNCTDIYVNDNRCEMYSIFPDYYERGMPKKKGEETKKPDGKGKKGKKDAGKKNKSNTQFSDSDSSGTPARRRSFLRDEAAAFEEAEMPPASDNRKLSIVVESPSQLS